MVKFPFVAGSYRARSPNFDSQRTVNLYPELSQSGTSKSVAALFGCPGHRPWLSLDVGAGTGIRGMLRFSRTQAVVVAGANVYVVAPDRTFVTVGTIGVVDTQVRMAGNGTTVMIVAGALGYFLDMTSYALTPIADPSFTDNGADTVQFVDGYFVWNETGTGRFRITKLYSTDIDPLAFGTAEGSPDLLLSLLVDHREVWLFGETSTEVYFNSGNADFPFERIQGAFIEQGCAAKFSPAKLDNCVFWLCADERGQGTVQRAQGYQPQRISTHALEFALNSYARIDDAIGYTYQQEGHTFYVLTFPTANATWSFDTTTSEWHERVWRNPADSSWNRIRSQCQMAYAGEVLVGDWETGDVYSLDLDYYVDRESDLLPAVRQTPYVGGQGDLITVFHKLWVDMETGVGINGEEGLYGTDPQVVLQWSDDGGHTWSNEMSASVGRIGEYAARCTFRRLGSSRSSARARIFRVTQTEPVRRCWIQAGVEATEGNA